MYLSVHYLVLSTCVKAEALAISSLSLGVNKLSVFSSSAVFMFVSDDKEGCLVTTSTLLDWLDWNDLFFFSAVSRPIAEINKKY